MIETLGKLAGELGSKIIDKGASAIGKVYEDVKQKSREAKARKDGLVEGVTQKENEVLTKQKQQRIEDQAVKLKAVQYVEAVTNKSNKK